MKRTLRFSVKEVASFSLLHMLICSFLMMLAFSGCQKEQAQPKGYLSLLTKKEDFLDMSYTTSSVDEQYRWQTVKVYFEKNTDSIYFMDTKKFKAHDDFMRNVLKLKSYPEEDYFLEEDERFLYRATLNMLSYQEKDILLMQIDAGDTLSAKAIKAFYDKVKEKITFEVGLYFNPVSHLQEVKVGKTDSMPVLTNDQVLRNAKQIVYSDHKSYGFLRKWSAGKCFSRKDIVVFNTVPPDDIVTGGIITEQPQARLSHLSLMSHKDEILNVYYKDASTKLVQYFDKPVEVEVVKGKLKIEVIKNDTEKLVKDLWESKSRKRNEALLSKSTPSKDLLLINDFDVKTKDALSMSEYRRLVADVGGKSANLTLVKNLYPQTFYENFNVYFPGSVSLSFKAFDEFMNQKDHDGLTLRQKVETIVEEIKSIEESSTCDAVDSLKKIRDIIKDADVPKEHLAELKKYIMEDESSPVHLSKQVRLRLRSSSNFEDSSYNMGAGLFESKGIWLYNKKDKEKTEHRSKSHPRSWDKIKESLSKKIPKVYASVFSEKVYAQIQREGLSVEDILKIKMGVLIHRAFPRYDFNQEDGELANGVAITKNIFNDERDNRGVYINAQHRDISITNPPPLKEVKELFPQAKEFYSSEEILIPWEPDNDTYVGLEEEYKHLDYNYLSRSSLTDKSIFNDSPKNYTEPNMMELRMFVHVLKKINSRLDSFFNEKRKPFEFEFKIYGKTRRIWIKQARPYVL